MKKFRIELVGTAPLLMHNVRLSNPLDEAAKAMKEVTKKRLKTDTDYEDAARLEHAGGMYFDKDLGPYLPDTMILACLQNAARKTRQGTKVKEGIFMTTPVNPLVYDGPRTIEDLWADENYRLIVSVRVTQARVMRCRPKFDRWATEAEGVLDEESLSLADLKSIAKTAGAIVGVGDWRPTYGRFQATVTELKN